MFQFTAELSRMWVGGCLLTKASPEEWDRWFNHYAEICAPADDYHPSKFRKQWIIKLLHYYYIIITLENGEITEPSKSGDIDDILDCLTFYGVWE